MSAATATQSTNGTGRDQSPLDSALSETERLMASRPELMQMKMENETIISECRARPRDFKAIKAELKDLLDAFPEFAESAIYCKPVGKDESGRMKHAEGLSIRAAEALAEAYKYNRIRADVTPMDVGAKIDATFTDFQTGRIWQDAGIVSQYYKSRRGGMQKHPDDRFNDVVIKAAKSKLIREVILRSVNSALKAWFENECRKTAALQLTDERVDEILNAFKSIKVTRGMLEDFVGKPIAMGWNQSDRLKMLGVYNAINNGETTVSEAFGDKPSGPVTGNDLSNPTKVDESQDSTEQPAELSTDDLRELEMEMEDAIKACTSASDIAKFRKTYGPKHPKATEAMASMRLEEISTKEEVTS